MSDQPPDSTRGPVYSRYADGTPVYKDSYPPRLPVTKPGDPIPDPVAEGFPHTRLRWDTANNRIYQGRQFGFGGRPECDLDFTVEIDKRGRPQPGVSVPHKQSWEQNIPGNPRSGYKRSRKHEKLSEDDYFSW